MKSNEFGRSMIEMLGVLAIVGVLSAGGIAGYSKAMMTYRMNLLVEDYIYFINGCLQSLDTILKSKEYHVAQFLNKLNVVPDSWTVKGTTFYDRNEHIIFPYLVKELYIEYALNRTDEALTSDNIRFCKKLWNDVVRPYSDVIYRVFLFSGNSPNAGTRFYYGNKFCGKNRPCLFSITLTEIDSECSSCVEDGRCVFNFTFK